MMIGDNLLLEQFARDRSEPAFGELVTRHIDLVYAVALRRVNGDTHLAEDITQSVFIDLARKAGRLPREMVLAGWLHRHTCFTAANAIRTERRRKTREQTAMEIRALDDNTPPPWEQIAPYIDDGLNQLNPADRDALVLRFLKRQDLRAVGAALGISEDAAQKRVTRALEELRGVLGARGRALTAVALAAVLATPATAAPTGLAAGVTMASLAATAKTGTTLTLLKLMASTKLQSGLVAAILIASITAPVVVQQQARAALNAQATALRQQSARLAELQQAHAQLTNALAAGSPAPSVPGNQFNEVLKLRGEIGVLNASLKELHTARTNHSLTRDEALDSLRQVYQSRVNDLKQKFAVNPAIGVPEIQYLPDEKWLELVEYDHHGIDPDQRSTLASIRSSAQIHFAMGTLYEALRKYGAKHDGQFPTEISELTPYFKAPVDDAVLRDWKIVPTSNLPEQLQVGGQWAITQKGPVDVENDQRVAMSLKQITLGRNGPNQWAETPQ